MQEGKVVLYIEDDPTNRILLRKILENEGFTVFEAEDGLAGIEIANRETVDIIILDINMSGMNGYEIATRIKAIDKLQNTPLVAFTANVVKSSRAKALISGCDGYITKPIDREHFLQKISEYLAGKKDTIESDKIHSLIKEYNVSLVMHLEKEIRELKRLNEDLKELDKMKSDFISIASHELRTPLVTIIGYVSLLLSNKLGELSPQQNKMLAVVERNSKRLERIIKDFFTLSQLENKTRKVVIQEANLEDLAESVVEDFALILEDRNLEATICADENLPLVECDIDNITQVFISVINNSIKFTENGGKIYINIRYPSSKIENVSEFDKNNFVDIIIEDTGIGIPQSKLNKIFEKFTELGEIEKHHSSETEFMGCGTGLGLSISKGIIENHKGFIWAENRNPVGTTIAIVLPIKQNIHNIID